MLISFFCVDLEFTTNSPMSYLYAVVFEHFNLTVYDSPVLFIIVMAALSP